MAAKAAKRTGPGVDRGRQGRAGLLPDATHDYVRSDDAVLHVLLLLSAARDGGGARCRQVAGLDHLLHCFVGRTGDHSSGTADGHLRPPVGGADVVDHPVAGKDAGGCLFRCDGVIGIAIGGIGPQQQLVAVF